MKRIKKITLRLSYYKSKCDKEKGIYSGGACAPKYIDELKMNVSEDYDFDMDRDEFKKNGMYALEISGSNRALKEFGKFLINIALFQTDDKDYHEHIDSILNNNGDEAVNLIIRKTDV